MGVDPKIGDVLPQNGWFISWFQTLLNWMIWGVKNPIFGSTPKWRNFWIAFLPIFFVHLKRTAASTNYFWFDWTFCGQRNDFQSSIQSKTTLMRTAGSFFFGRLVVCLLKCAVLLLGVCFGMSLC